MNPKKDNKTNKPEILRLDLFYRINAGLQRDMKKIFIADYRFAGISQTDDLELFEFYEILKLPVIQLVNPATIQKPFIRLTVFCYSCFRGCKYLNLFTGEKWQFYIVS